MYWNKKQVDNCLKIKIKALKTIEQVKVKEVIKKGSEEK